MSDSIFNGDNGDFINNKELESSNQMSKINSAKMKIISSMKDTLCECEQNLKFNEEEEFSLNISILSRYISSMAEINSLMQKLNSSKSSSDFNQEDEDSENNEVLSEDEILDKIEEIGNKAKSVSIDDLFNSVDNEPDLNGNNLIDKLLDDKKNSKKNNDDNEF